MSGTVSIKGVDSNGIRRPARDRATEKHGWTGNTKKAPLSCDSGASLQYCLRAELEAEAESQLQSPGIAIVIRLSEIVVAGGNRAARIITAESGVDAPDLGMIEQVENLAAELQFHGFREGEVLDEVYVDVTDAGQAKRVPARIAERAIRRTGESGRVEPLEAVLPRISAAREIGILAAPT